MNSFCLISRFHYQMWYQFKLKHRYGACDYRAIEAHESAKLWHVKFYETS